MILPMAPSATISTALSIAGTWQRSEKLTDQRLPVSSTVRRKAATSARLTQPGLSHITSLPWLIASIDSRARSAGTAATRIRSITGSSRGRRRSSTCGISPKFNAVSSRTSGVRSVQPHSRQHADDVHVIGTNDADREGFAGNTAALWS